MALILLGNYKLENMHKCMHLQTHNILSQKIVQAYTFPESYVTSRQRRQARVIRGRKTKELQSWTHCERDGKST